MFFTSCLPVASPLKRFHPGYIKLPGIGSQTATEEKLPLADDILPAGEAESEFADWREFMLSDAETPETEYLKNMFWEALDNALKELPEEQKQAFTLHELEGVSFNEMEKMLGIPAATLVSRKRYAVLHLRERLEGLKNEILNY